jgi:hypothetical protein
VNRGKTARLSVAGALLNLGILTAAAFGADAVRVLKTPSGWQLRVGERPFWVKGIGCNEARGEKGEDYLRMARDMGANALRTWGGAPRSYLDQAHAYGLKVHLGIWINPIRSGMTESYRDQTFCDRLSSEILGYVNEMKDHPALLAWIIGNETFRFTERDDEREALGAFLERVVGAVHQADPRHPVVYASAETDDLPFLQKYAPSIDIVGVNEYGGLPSVFRWMKEHAYDRPVLVTEYGPAGGWELNKDGNGLPYDPSDQLKAANYVSRWREIEAERNRCLGGIAFLLGEQRNQDSLTWFNVNFGDQKREAYWALSKLYGGQAPAQPGPKITAIRLEPAADTRSGDPVTVAASVSSLHPDALRYRYFITDIAKDPLLVVPPRFFPTQETAGPPGRAELHSPNEPGLYRVYAAVSDGQGNVAIADRSLRVR